MIPHTTELQLGRTEVEGIHFQYANGKNPSTQTLSVVHTTHTRLHLHSNVLDFVTTQQDDLWRSRSSRFHLAHWVLRYYSLQYSQEMLVADFIPTCYVPKTWQGIPVRRGVRTERIIDPMCRSLSVVCQMGESKAKYVLTLYLLRFRPLWYKVYNYQRRPKSPARKGSLTPHCSWGVAFLGEGKLWFQTREDGTRQPYTANHISRQLWPSIVSIVYF